MSNMDQEKAIAARLSDISSVDTAIILGTGLGVMEEDIQVNKIIPYEDIPGFPRTSVKGHTGRLIFGSLENHDIVAMSGRFHLYEGYTPKEITLPIRIFKLMGINNLFISNAAGGLRPDLKPGGIMLIIDHINSTGQSPLIGPNNEEIGPRFPDMTKPYTPEFIRKAVLVAKDENIDLKQGVYVQVLGPSMETASETRMLRVLGADAVGMSTVMEVIQARHCGMNVLAISAITNNNDPDDYKPAPLKKVIEMAGVAGPSIIKIFKGVLRDISN
ncbi:MAG: purine-nucleoside phosphorylase [Deltaproteobacteria bacterium]|nr:purine-nucleoside phosphorylase [Deltaproteobacteria bacterium]